MCSKRYIYNGFSVCRMSKRTKRYVYNGLEHFATSESPLMRPQNHSNVIYIMVSAFVACQNSENVIYNGLEHFSTIRITPFEASKSLKRYKYNGLRAPYDFRKKMGCSRKCSQTLQI